MRGAPMLLLLHFLRGALPAAVPVSLAAPDGAKPKGPEVPWWTAPPFSATGPVSATKAYGMPVAQNTTSVKIYNATMDWENGFGVYSHAAMLAFHGGHFLASWKNAVLSEDTPGQRILWAWSSEAQPLKYSSPTVLFPNISNGSCTKWRPGTVDAYPQFPSYLSPGCAHLFAEPAAVVNNNVYLAASTRQFCLWPLDPLNDGGTYLLLREVSFETAGPGTGGGGAPRPAPVLGDIFWAKDPSIGSNNPWAAAWAETNARLGLKLLDQMDAETQADVKALLAGKRPCAQNASTTKCEYCSGGCQSIRAAGAKGAPCALADVGGPWVERTHWVVPGTSTDVLVYR